MGITTLPDAMFRANPQHTGEYDNCGVDPSNTLLWRFKTGGKVNSSPAVSNGIIYIGSDDNNLYAIDAATGNEKWRFAMSVYESSSPSVSNGVVYIGSFDNNLYAIDAVTGKEKWRCKTGSYVQSSPAVFNGVVYIGSDDNLYAIDAGTGKEIWRFRTGSRLKSSPAVSNGIVYVGSGNKILAIDAMMGKEKWRLTTGWLTYVESSPAVSNGVVYVGSSNRNLHSIDALTGKEKWRFETVDDVDSSPAVSNGVVYVGGKDKNLYAIDSVTGKEKWRFATRGCVYSSPAVFNGIVYVGSNDGNLYAIDAVTGEEIWRFTTGREVKSSPAVFNGVVYVGSNDGNLYAIGANAKPVLTFTFDHISLIANRWHKIGVPVSNTGNSPAFNVNLSFSDEFEVKRVQPITVEAGKLATVEFGILSTRDGTIPFEITLDYRDAVGTRFKESQAFWIDVVEKETIPPTPKPVNEVSISEKNETHPQIIYNISGSAHIGDKTQTDIKDSVIQRSNFGTGIPLDRKVCPRCQKKIEGNEKFCSDCGQDLRE